MMVITTSGMAAAVVLWLAPGGLPVLMVVALAYGLFAGAFASILPAVLAERVPADAFPGAVGIVYTAPAVTMLLGPPIVGALFDATGSYTAAIVVVLATQAAAVMVFAALRQVPASAWA